MRVQPGQMIALGYGKYALSEEIIAVEAITEGRGPGRRSLVWVRGVKEPLVASRSEGAILDDIVTPAEEAARMRQQRAALQQMVRAFDSIPVVLRRVLKEENGVGLESVANQARQILG